jgi:signal transduction histidine kinase
VIRFYWRLLLSFCAASIATLLLGVAIAPLFVRHSFGSAQDWTALAEAANTAYIRSGKAGLHRWQQSEHRHGVLGYLFEEGRNLEPHPPMPPPLQDELQHLLSNPNIVLHPRSDIYLVGQAVVGNDNVARHFVCFRGPNLREGLNSLLTAQILLSILAIGVVGWWLSRGVAGPVAALSGAARRMADGELSSRVAPKWTRGSDEISELARDFNAMAARIEALIQQERSVLQDISHELRSPLARLQLNLELARSGDSRQFERAEREVMRLDRLLTEVLALARLENELPGMMREPFDLAALARDRVEETRSAHPGIRIDLDAPQPVPLSGSSVLLERALDNLLSNAVKYGAGSAVDVAVRAEDGLGVVSVRDHGAGAAEDDLPLLFRPFFRGRNTAGSEGQGLGLAAVARIVRAHGGAISAGNARGGGLEVVLRVPLRPPLQT